MTTLERTYPNAKITGINQVYIENIGWIDSDITNGKDAMTTINRGVDLHGRKITEYSLTIEDADGIARVVDFRRHEII